MITQQQWNIIRCVVDKANKSCSHVSIATVNADGSPHVTPIGTLALHDDPSGYFFDELCTVSRTNLDRNPQLCILAVNAGMPFWIKSLVMGKFSTPPAVRLVGTVKPLREAAPEEIAAWRRHVAKARLTKGYEIMWSRMHLVRDVQFDSFEAVNCGKMTAGLL
ncbi:MAG: pyridoxamine 5'-phosphate oxidase family protein [Dehalococcoidales bacterium]|jgi:hypothetical protein